MASFTSKEAKNRLGEVFRAALSEPVVITNHGKPVVRIVSALTMPSPGEAQNRLDRVKHKISCEVLAKHSTKDIKSRSLANLRRWKSQGTWSLAYDDWTKILEKSDDHELIASMVGLDERSNQLRQSMPYVGMLDQDLVRKLREEA